MRVVIDIPEDDYNRWTEDGEIDALVVRDALKNAAQLPKGHAYIDRNNAITSVCQYYKACEGKDMASFSPNVIKQQVADILRSEPAAIDTNG